MILLERITGDLLYVAAVILYLLVDQSVMSLCL